MVKIIRTKNSDSKVDVTLQSKNNFYVIKSILKSYVGSWYDKTNRVWKISIEDVDDFVDKVVNFDDEIVQADLGIYDVAQTYVSKRKDLLDLRNSLDGADSGVKLLKNYQLMPFQHVGVKFLTEVRHGIIADKVGLGKTMQGFCAAYKMIKMDRIADKCIVIVPNSLKVKWKRDIEKFLGEESVLLEGAKNERQGVFREWLNSDSLFLITSYDTLRIDYERYISETMFCNFGVICDEIQYLKNTSTKRSQRVREFVNGDLCKFRLGLSATYVETGLEDLFGVMLVIDENVFGKSYYRFVDRYLKVNYVGKVIGYRNVEEATYKMKFSAIRRHKEQVKDQLKTFLPKINVNTLWVELSKIQKKAYNEVLDKVVEQVLDMEKADKISMANIMSQMLYLRQVSISTGLIYHQEESSAKMDTLKEIIPSIVEDNKVVIFCFFVDFIDYMEKEFNKMGINCIAMHGKRPEGKASVRQDYIDKFQNSKDIPILLTSDILKEGVDLEKTSYVINTDILWNPASMVQRIGRIDRLNQVNSNIYAINIWSQGTIEEEMAKRIYEREELATQVMDDGYIEKRVRKITFSDVKKMLRMAR